jgi:hypothetical protein
MYVYRRVERGGDVGVCINMVEMNRDSASVRVGCETVRLRRQARTAGTIIGRVRALLDLAARPIRFGAVA